MKLQTVTKLLEQARVYIIRRFQTLFFFSEHKLTAKIHFIPFVGYGRLRLLDYHYNIAAADGVWGCWVIYIMYIQSSSVSDYGVIFDLFVF